MLQKCNLTFEENSILTRDMLLQMNAEPKWLVLCDYFRNIKYGVISGFEFVNSDVDDYSILTKGNIIIDGEWYRMKEDYNFSNEMLTPGKFYNIFIKYSSQDSYEILISEENNIENAYRIARFKYDSRTHHRTFRVPNSIDDLSIERLDAIISDVTLPYYNNHGIAICPKYVTECIKEYLLKKQSKYAKEEIILQNIMNSGYLSISSLRNLVGSELCSENYLGENDYMMIKKWINGADSNTNNYSREMLQGNMTKQVQKKPERHRGF